MLNYLPTHILIYLYILVFILGAVMGSALNCLALRLASGKKWSGNQRSACPACGHVLAAKDLIPLVSYLTLGGKCRYCRAPVSKRYILSELGLGLVYTAVLALRGLSLSAVSAIILFSCLFSLSLVDLDTQIIPDRFLLIPLVFRVLELLLTGGLSSLLPALLPGLIFGGFVLALSLIMDKVLKKDTMGGGDIKLIALLGCFLSIPEMLLMILLSCILGIVIASILMKIDAETPFPFGPALSLAAYATMLFGEKVISWYLSLF